MKYGLIAFTILCSFVMFSFVAVAHEEAELVRVIHLSSCQKTAAFDSELLRRVTHPAFDRIYYDLNYFAVATDLVVGLDRRGNKVFEKTVVRCTPGSRRFEVSERYGNEASLEREVRQYIKSQEFFACAAAVVCS